METIDANNFLSEIELDRKLKEKRTKDIKIASEQAELEANMLIKYVENNSNPNPLYIIIYSIVIFLLIWIIYVFFIKSNASGEWIDNNNNIWYLKHNYVIGSLKVLVNDSTMLNCRLSGNLFRCNDLIGVWDYNDNIIFVGGGWLTRIRK